MLSEGAKMTDDRFVYAQGKPILREHIAAAQLRRDFKMIECSDILDSFVLTNIYACFVPGAIVFKVQGKEMHGKKERRSGRAKNDFIFCIVSQKYWDEHILQAADRGIYATLPDAFEQADDAMELAPSVVYEIDAAWRHAEVLIERGDIAKSLDADDLQSDATPAIKRRV